MNPLLELGPKLYLGYFSAGLYFNMVEFLDLTVGLVGADPLQDDEPAPPKDPEPQPAQEPKESSQPHDEVPAQSHSTRTTKTIIGPRRKQTTRSPRQGFPSLTCTIRQIDFSRASEGEQPSLITRGSSWVQIPPPLPNTGRT